MWVRSWIIVSNFLTFRVHDLNKEHPEKGFLEFGLADLRQKPHLLDFLLDASLARETLEQEVSIKAGELIGELHAALSRQYLDPDSVEESHALNVLCVRLVFCLYAEDAGLFGKDTFLGYLSGFEAGQMRPALLDLFKVLDTPPEARDPYLSDTLKAFPYVNGGLFAGEFQIPQFTAELKTLLVERTARDTDWSRISPTIFGGIFESTLNPETRRSGGMHYTDPVNIHKVIDPLFLDGLKAELEAILNDTTLTPRQKTNRLTAFQDKLASQRYLDTFRTDWIQTYESPGLAA